MPRTLTSAAAVIAAALGAVTLAACGSSTPSQSASSVSTTTTTAATPTTGPVSAAPAVANATDLHTAPVPAPGSPPPPTNLVVKDLVVGSGSVAHSNSTVQVQYVGTNFANGQSFDSSWSRGKPASFPLGGTIPGFAQGISGMKVGGRRELVIPPALAYGPQGKAPGVGPNETLVFVIDLLAVS